MSALHSVARLWHADFGSPTTARVDESDIGNASVTICDVEGSAVAVEDD